SGTGRAVGGIVGVGAVLTRAAVETPDREPRCDDHHYVPTGAPSHADKRERDRPVQPLKAPLIGAVRSTRIPLYGGAGRTRHAGDEQVVASCDEHLEAVLLEVLLVERDVLHHERELGLSEVLHARAVEHLARAIAAVGDAEDHGAALGEAV